MSGPSQTNNFGSGKTPTPLIKLMPPRTQYTKDVIPPRTEDSMHERTLAAVVCLDGTGDKFDDDNTNVINFFSLLAKGESTQLVYYQPGIGTYNVTRVNGALGSGTEKILDKALAGSLRHHVMAAYEFLMDNFKFGDKICLFGFSRGGYTARALAGMIAKVGLLPSGNHQQVPFAYEMYMKDEKNDCEESMLFKKTFSTYVRVEFVGVWDTVDSVGFVPRHSPYVKKNSCVKTFRHALALDERRVKFKHNCYDMTGSSIEEVLNKSEDQSDADVTDACEVWFAGCHSDVGGGSVKNSVRYSLARIPLRWMVRECFLSKSGIQFHAGRLHEIGLDTSTLGVDANVQPENPIPSEERCFLRDEELPGDGSPDNKQCISTDKTLQHLKAHLEGGFCELPAEEALIDEYHENCHDALSPMYDQLSRKWLWWILEWIPFIDRQIGKDGKVTRKLIFNRGRPRILSPEEQARLNVHDTVRIRMERSSQVLGKPYNPRVQFESDKTTWVFQ